MAYFAAFELRAYQEFIRIPEGLILDLGCGDGTFSQMLKELLGFKTSFIGVDIDREKLRVAAGLTSIYSQVLELDVSQLPFKEGIFDAVLSNGLLYCLRPNPRMAVREVQRILKEGGKFICTVPTENAEKHYIFAEWFRKMKLNRYEGWYRRRLNTRMGNVSLLSSEKWVRMLEDSGLTICKVVPYISEAISRRWNLLVELPRLTSALRLIPFKQVHRLASIIQKCLMHRSYQDLSTLNPSEIGDYLLIVSEKNINTQPSRKLHRKRLKA